MTRKSAKVTCLLALLLAGCAVQLGRNPERTYELGTVKPPEKKTSEPKEADPVPETSEGETRPDAAEPDERNWRFGPEAPATPDAEDPAHRYEDLYRLFRADHREAERLSESGKRPLALSYNARALRWLETMKPMLSAEEESAFVKFVERYADFIREGDAMEGTRYRSRARAFASEAARWTPGKAPLRQ